MVSVELDELDKKILEIIKDNARLTYSEIAEKVGFTRVHVKTRMTRMEEKGIIKGYYTEISDFDEENGVRFEMLFDVEPEYYDSVVNELIKSDIISDLHSVTGDCRLMAVGMARNSATLDSYAKGLFKGLRGVKRISWNVVLATYKKGGIIYESETDTGGDNT